MISMTLLGVLGLATLFVLLALRMPVALSMLGVGLIGTVIANANKFINIGMASEQAWARGWKIAYSNLAGETFEAASNFNLLVIPMFVLMGNLAGASGMSRDLFVAAYRWMGHLRGGLHRPPSLPVQGLPHCPARLWPQRSPWDVSHYRR